MARTLRLADGRSAALQRDELAEACVPDLPDAVLAHRGPCLIRESRAAELDGVDDLRAVRALERHGGDGRADVLRQREACEAPDHALECRAVLEQGDAVGDRGPAPAELLVRA